MTSEKIWLRTEILGTQVITRNTGKRLGVVSELKVDIDRREVVALGLRDSMLTRLIPGGISKYMLLESIRQIGDVILVDDENIIVDVDPEEYSNLINCEVVTETQELLGRVRNFKFDVETGKISALIIASIGLPLVPEQVVSTYELDVEEIVTNGPDRIIVFEGAEERLNQVSVGLLERLGIAIPPWEQEDDEDYVLPKASVENQLGTGSLVRNASPPMRRTPVMEETWDDDNWEELEPAVRQPLRQPRQQARYYDQPSEPGWNESSERSNYRRDVYGDEDGDDQEYDELESDAWNDGKQPQSYQPPRINIPEKTKAPEYEEETNW